MLKSGLLKNVIIRTAHPPRAWKENGESGLSESTSDPPCDSHYKSMCWVEVLTAFCLFLCKFLKAMLESVYTKTCWRVLDTEHERTLTSVQQSWPQLMEGICETPSATSSYKGMDRKPLPPTAELRSWRSPFSNPRFAAGVGSSGKYLFWRAARFWRHGTGTGSAAPDDVLAAGTLSHSPGFENMRGLPRTVSATTERCHMDQ